MSDKKYLSFLNFKGSLLEIRDKFARNAIGSLESLMTADKGNIVNAINEIFSKVKIDPVAKTNGMTQEVGMDKSGKLFTTPFNLTTDTELNQTGKAADGAIVGNYFKSLTLGRGEDGLVYIFLNNKPIGTGLDLSDSVIPNTIYNINDSTAVIEDINDVIKSSINDDIYSASDPTGSVKSHILNKTLFVS